MADLYGTDPFDVQELLNRMDVVPPSLALAQAAEESGWGTSRFARQGNALFGQYTYNAKPGIVPAQRDADRRHRVRSHDNLLAAVRAYVHNLNSHWAYEDFRRKRSRLRRAGETISGYVLAGELRSLFGAPRGLRPDHSPDHSAEPARRLRPGVVERPPVDGRDRPAEQASAYLIDAARASGRNELQAEPVPTPASGGSSAVEPGPAGRERPV